MQLQVVVEVDAVVDVVKVDAVLSYPHQEILAHLDVVLPLLVLVLDAENI